MQYAHNTLTVCQVCTVKINFYLSYLASTSVMFRESSYSIDEDEGSVRIVLMLNSSSANDITIQVTNDDDSATSE